MKRYFPLALIAIMLAFAGTAAIAADDSNNDVSQDTAQEKMNSGPGYDTYVDMDANSDDRVSQDEFFTYYNDDNNSGLFDSWDANDDGSIDNQEFNQGLYHYYDGDNDGYIMDDEWGNGGMMSGGYDAAGS